MPYSGLEEAREDLKRAKAEVLGQGRDSGSGFMTTFTFGTMGNEIFIWSDGTSVRVTKGDSADSPEISDEEAAGRLLRGGQKLGKCGRVFRLESESDIDEIMTALGFD